MLPPQKKIWQVNTLKINCLNIYYTPANYFSYFAIYFSIFRKSNSFLHEFEYLEKCLEFLREFRRPLGCLLKLPLYPQKGIGTVLISGL